MDQSLPSLMFWGYRRCWRLAFVALLALVLPRPVDALEGIGAAIAQVQEDLFAIRVFPGSPADKGGMKSGDAIVSIEGRSARGMPVSDAVALLRGPKGSQLNLVVRHMGSKSTSSVVIGRDVIDVPEDVRRLLEEREAAELDREDLAVLASDRQMLFALLSSVSYVEPGEEFEVAFHVSNPGMLRADRWQSVIEYDASRLSFVGYYPSPDAPDGALASAWLVGERILLRPEAPGLQAVEQGTWLMLVFRAKPSPGMAAIRFVRDGEGEEQGQGVFARRDGRDALGDPSVDGDGLIDFLVEIAPVSLADSRSLPLPRTPEVALTSAEAGGTSGVRRVQLSLLNPDGAPVSRLNLTFYYNPQDMEALDTDRGNWIRNGLNIGDGPYHEAFYFDFHNENAIEPERGKIVYDMGALQQAVSSQGVFAHVDFRPREGVTQSVLVLRRAEITVDLPFVVDPRSSHAGDGTVTDDGNLDWILIDFSATDLGGER